MVERMVPAQRRYARGTVATPDGELTVGHWRPRRIYDHPDAPTVVAIHGITGNHRCFAFFADSLPHVRVLAPDLRGRGGSSAVGGPYGMAAHAADIVAVMDHYGVERAHLVGHSMGAFVATVTAHRYPDRVLSLVLADGGLPMTIEIPDDPDAVVERGTAALRRRIETTYRTVDHAIAWWHGHPAFLGEWSTVVADYVTYDLGGPASRYRSRVVVDALTEDARDLVAGTVARDALDGLQHEVTVLLAGRGLLGQQPGLYTTDLIMHWARRYPTIEVVPMRLLNHYTMILSRGGAEAVADVLLRRVPLPPPAS